MTQNLNTLQNFQVEILLVVELYLHIKKGDLLSWLERWSDIKEDYLLYPKCNHSEQSSLFWYFN